MNKIEQLISKLCPNGVEFKRLGEVCDILDNQRIPIAKDKRKRGIYPYYGANGIQDYVDGYIFDGDYILMGEDGSVMNMDNTPVVNWATGKFWVNNHAHILSSKSMLILRYVYFYLQTIDISQFVAGTPPKINQANLKQIKIPVPPIEIQEEIVKILDNFSELKSELKSELIARKKQYEYYRNTLLDFGDENNPKDNVEFKRLGEVCDILDNQRIPIAKDKRKRGIYPYYGANGIQDYVDGYIFDGDYILMGEDGSVMNMDNTPVVNWATGKFWVNNHAHILSSKSMLILRYVYFYLQTIDISQFVAGTPPKINQANLKQIKIPVPPLETQQKIVNILDQFEALTTDYQSGLPAEIEARNKQYEYYRNRLLTFKELKSVE